MKHCPYCGKEYPDDVEFCAADNNRLVSEQETVTPQAAPSPPVVRSNEISPEEQRYWQRMTFRQFAILTIRLQAMWLFFTAVVDATYVVRYLIRLIGMSAYSASTIKSDLFWMVINVLLHVAAAVWLIQNSERFLSWLVKDSATESAAKSD